MSTLRFISLVVVLAALHSCKEGQAEAQEKYSSVTMVTDRYEQDSLFRQLLRFTGERIEAPHLDDSIAFLVLPLEAACPSCRKKTIDSIETYQNRLPADHFVILSGTSLKMIRSIYQEQGKEVPASSHNIIIDSTNEAFIQDIVYTKPAIYYAVGQKVYKKVSSKPITIKEDLAEFFQP